MPERRDIESPPLKSLGAYSVWFTSAAVMSIAFILLAAFQVRIPYSGSYVDRHAIHPQWIGLVYPGVLMVIVLLLYWGSLTNEGEWADAKKSGWMVVGLLALIVGLKFLIHFSMVLFVHEFSLSAAVWPFIQRLGDGAYHVAASQIENLHEFFSGFQARFLESERDPLLPHLETHPPGPTLFFYVIIKVLVFFPGLRGWLETTSLELSPVLRETLGAATMRESDVFAFPLATAIAASLVCFLLSAIAVPLVYLVCREFAGRKWSFMIAGATVFFPGAYSYNPGIDQALGVPALLMALFAVKALRALRWYYGALFGLATFLAMSISLAFLVPLGMVVWGLAFAAIAMRRVRSAPDWKSLASTVLAAVAGFFVPVLALILTYQFNLITVLLLCYRNNASWHEGYGNDYWPWAFSNLVETLYSMGPPAALFLFGFAVLKLKGLVRYRKLELCEAYYWGVTFTFFLLCTFAVNRGEVARLWLFLFPLLWTAVASVSPERMDSKSESTFIHRAFIGMLSLQAICVLILGASTDPLETSKTFYNVLNKFGG